MLRIAALCAALILSGCATSAPAKTAESKPAPAPAAAPAKSEAPAKRTPQHPLIGALEQAYAAFNAHRFAEAFTLLADGAHWDLVGEDLGPLSGKGAAISYYETLLTAVSDYRVGARRIFVSDSLVVAEAVACGTNDGELRGQPATGKAFGIPELQVFELQDGKVTRVRVFLNAHAMLQQLGHLPGPAPALSELPTGAPEIIMGAPKADSVAVVEAHLKAYTAGDVAAVRAAGAAGARVIDYGGGEKKGSWQDHVAEMEAVTKAFTQMQMPAAKVVSFGDWVFADVRTTGKHTGEFGGVPASGKEVDVSFGELYRIEGGKVAEQVVYSNPLAMLRQLGLLDGVM